MTINYIDNLFSEKRTQKSHTRVMREAGDDFAGRVLAEAWKKSNESDKEAAKECGMGASKTDVAEQREDLQRDFQKGMLAFYERVQEQIKNGPPKFRIGGAEMSEEEWEKLLEKVDTNLDAVKEEQEKRFARQEEEAESETAVHSEILTKADGSKVLAVTREIAGTEVTSYLKIDDGADGQLL